MSRETSRPISFEGFRISIAHYLKCAIGKSKCRIQLAQPLHEWLLRIDFEGPGSAQLRACFDAFEAWTGYANPWERCGLYDTLVSILEDELNVPSGKLHVVDHAILMAAQDYEYDWR